MASTKELQNRIGSIRDTMKITNAMYMISSMKLRKAKKKLENTEPYFLNLQLEISNILLHFPDFQHLYFRNRDEDEKEEVKEHPRRAYLIIFGDKGMAGAYNSNVLKEALAELRENHDEHARLFVVGEVGRRMLPGMGYQPEKDFAYSANNPSIHRARLIAGTLLDLYRREEIDEIRVIYTEMINSMSSVVKSEQLLPLKTHTFLKKELIEKAMSQQGDKTREQIEREAEDWYRIYPTPEKVLEKLVDNYITGYVYGTLVESSASEENARMMAMKSATDNAKDMLADLSLRYNHERQSAITQEITEVIGGAKALKKKKQAMVSNKED